MPGAPFSGINSRSGDVISFKAKNLSVDNPINGPGRIYVSLVVETLVELRDGSVAVLD